MLRNSLIVNVVFILMIVGRMIIYLSLPYLVVNYMR